MKHTFFSTVALAAALAAVATSLSAATPARHTLATGALGKGRVTLWQQGSRLGATIDKAALDSLPRTEARVDLDANAAPFRLVEIDWHPYGHGPKGIYDVAHIDAHFYVITKQERDAIAFAPPGRVARPLASIVPQGYISDGTVIPQMGMHFVSAAQPEFHGKRFMASQIWGYDKGRLAFVEAMFSSKFIRSNGSFEEALPRPALLPLANTLPGRMAVERNGALGYDITLTQ